MSLEELQRGSAVLAQHALKLDQVHRRVERDAQPVLVGGATRGLQQFDRAGVQLGRVQQTPHSAVVGSVMLLRERDRALQPSLTRGRIVVPLDAAVVVEHVRIRLECRPEVHPRAELADHAHEVGCHCASRCPGWWSPRPESQPTARTAARRRRGLQLDRRRRPAAGPSTRRSWRRSSPPWSRPERTRAAHWCPDGDAY